MKLQSSPFLPRQRSNKKICCREMACSESVHLQGLLWLGCWENVTKWAAKGAIAGRTSMEKGKGINHTTIPLQTISKELKTHLEGDSLDIRSRMYGL